MVYQMVLGVCYTPGLVSIQLGDGWVSCQVYLPMDALREQ